MKQEHIQTSDYCGWVNLDTEERSLWFMEEVEKSGDHLYWKYDEHMRGRGYTLAGQRIFKWWEDTNKNQADSSGGSTKHVPIT